MPVGVGELIAVGREPACSDWDNTRTHSSLSFVSGTILSRETTQNSFPVLCIFRIPGRMTYLTKWIVTFPDLNTHRLFVLGQVIFSFLSWIGGPCYMGFLKGLPVMNTKNLHIRGPWRFTFHQNILLQKTCLPTFPHHPSKNISSVKSWSFFCYEVNQDVECQLGLLPLETTAGRAGNAALLRVCSRWKDCYFQVGTM